MPRLDDMSPSDSSSTSGKLKLIFASFADTLKIQKIFVVEKKVFIKLNSKNVRNLCQF
jgi:hypothetical protein